MKYNLFNIPVTFDYNYMTYTFNESLANVMLTLSLIYVVLYYSVTPSIPEFREDLKQKLMSIKYFFLWVTTMFR